MNFWEFAGAHPYVTVLLVMLIVQAPVSIIRALRGPRPINLNFKDIDGN